MKTAFTLVIFALAASIPAHAELSSELVCRGPGTRAIRAACRQQFPPNIDPYTGEDINFPYRYGCEVGGDWTSRHIQAKQTSAFDLEEN